MCYPNTNLSNLQHLHAASTNTTTWAVWHFSTWEITHRVRHKRTLIFHCLKTSLNNTSFGALLYEANAIQFVQYSEILLCGSAHKKFVVVRVNLRQVQYVNPTKWISGNGFLYITGCFFERISRWLGKRERGNAQVVQSGYCIGPTITARLALSQRGQIPWCHFHLRDCNWCCPLSIRPLSLSPLPTQTGTTSCQEAKYGFVWRRNASGCGCSSLQLPDTSRVARGHCSQEVI